MDKELFNKIKKTLSSYIKDTDFENKVFVVGGCVRDMLLGLEIKDIDIAVNLPDGGIKLADYLSRYNKLHHHPVTYPSYGTAMFRLSEFPDIELEAVQTRKEKYPDPTRRNPVSVFGTLEEDCLRRDLTINSLYQNIDNDEIIDMTGFGLIDLRDEVIRTPCDPDITYDDDPLRILRTVRFASRYNWKIEKKTYESMKRNVHRIGIVSKERIQTEMTHMLTSPNADVAIKYLKDIGVFYIIAPELQFVCNDPDKWNRTVEMVRVVYPINHLELTLAALFGIMCAEQIDEYGTQCGFTETGVDTKKAEELLRSLKFSINVINRTSKIIRYHRIHPFPELLDHMIIECPFMLDRQFENIRFKINRPSLRCFQFNVKDESLFCEIMTLAEICWVQTTLGQICNPFPGIMNASNSDNRFFTYSLPVTGDVLINECGMKPGPEIKEMLHFLHMQAFENPELTKEEMIEIVKNNVK